MTNETVVARFPNTCYGTELGEGLASELLCDSDKVWLKELHNTEVEDDWINKANLLVPIGSKSVVSESDKRTEIISARRLFFEELLGWNDPEHPHYSVYKRIESKPTLITISIFINSMRLLHSSGIDTSKALHGNASLAWKSTEKILAIKHKLGCSGFNFAECISANPMLLNKSAEKLEAWCAAKTAPKKIYKMQSESLGFIVSYLEDSIGMTRDKAESVARDLPHREVEEIEKTTRVLEGLGPNYKKLVKADPRILSRSSSEIEKRGHGIGLASQLLGWEGDPEELKTYSHKLFMASGQRLLIYARLFGRFGSSDMSMSTIANFLSYPLESHFISGAFGDDYNLASVRSAYEAFSQEEQAEFAEQALADNPELFGEKLIRAYRIYKDKQN